MTAKKNIPRLGEVERSETFPSLAKALMLKMAQKNLFHLFAFARSICASLHRSIEKLRCCCCVNFANVHISRNKYINMQK